MTWLDQEELLRAVVPALQGEECRVPSALSTLEAREVMLVAVRFDFLLPEQIYEAEAKRICLEGHLEDGQAAIFQEGGKVEMGMGDGLGGKEEHPVGSLA